MLIRTSTGARGRQQKNRICAHAALAFTAQHVAGVRDTVCKAGGGNLRGERGGVEAVMAVKLRPVKRAVFALQISDAQIAARPHHAGERAQQGVSVAHMMQRHLGTEQINGRIRRRINR